MKDKTRLRIVNVDGFNAPVGTPVTYKGINVGSVVNNYNWYCECAIDNDTVHRLMQSDGCSLSLEVTIK